MKKLIRLTESDIHRIVKESVRRVIKEMGGDIITCFGSRRAITSGGNGGIFGNGTICLVVGYPPKDNPYDMGYGDVITVNVDASNFYRAESTKEAMMVAKNERDKYSGIIYHSNHDGDVCVVFDKSCILGKA